jgi:hypothetical protein
MGMANEEIISPAAGFHSARGPFRNGRPQARVIDQDGREIPESSF